VIVASFFVQDALMGLAAYRNFVTVAPAVGKVILVVAIFGLVCSLATGIFLTVRMGKPEEGEEGAIAGNVGPTLQPLDSPLSMKGAKVKTLYRSGASVQMESLVDGTATRAERLMISAVFGALASFFLVFVGVSLMIIGKFLIAVALPIPALLMLSYNARMALAEYRAAKKRLAARG